MKTNYFNYLRKNTAKSGWLGLLFLLLTTSIGANFVKAQVSTYNFSQSNGTYSAIVGGSVLGTATSNAGATTSLDTASFPGTLPFSFFFNGQNYTNFNMSSNGYITFGTGLATGSGTDGTIVCCNLESDRTYSNAGKHSKLGELIGLSVKEAVKKALDLQSGLNEINQKSILKRAKRYGVTSETLWENYILKDRKNMLHKLDYMDALFKIEKNETLVSYISLILHLLDQHEWKLLSKEVVAIHCQEILDKILLGITVNQKADNLVEEIIEKLKISINGLIGGSELV